MYAVQVVLPQSSTLGSVLYATAVYPATPLLLTASYML
jgi:hypothetical protein